MLLLVATTPISRLYIVDNKEYAYKVEFLFTVEIIKHQMQSDPERERESERETEEIRKNMD